jgi:hypothetical protein
LLKQFDQRGKFSSSGAFDLRNFIAVLIFVWPQLANAQNLDGNTVLSACDSNDITQVAFCAGYGIGLLEGMRSGLATLYVRAEMGGGSADVNSFVDQVLGFCIPAEVENGQIKDVYVKFLRDNPATRHESARILFLQAMLGAFPCQLPFLAPEGNPIP